MQNCVRKASLLAFAVLLTLSGSAFAGDNANVTFSITTPLEVSGVGPGDTVEVAISAAGMDSVRQVFMLIGVSPVDAFDLASSSFDNNLPNNPIDPGVLTPAPGQVELGAAIPGNRAAIDGERSLGTITLISSSTFTSTTEATITILQISIGPSATVRDIFTADQLGLSVAVNPPPPPPPPVPAPTVTSIAPTSGPAIGGTAVTITGADFQSGATVTIGGAAASNVNVTSATTITATTPAGTADAVVDVVVANPDGQSATLAGAFTYVGIIEPDLATTTPVDASLDFSPVGSGNTADNSAGEVTFTVRFTNNTGAAASGQTITWQITNNGAQPVFFLGTTVIQINAGASRTLSSSTGTDGTASAKFDAEGDKSAGSTSIDVTASTSAPNSLNETRNLSASFSATWDVPVPAELASFAAQVTVDKGILLQWSVASQSNNLGWEVYRSMDKVRFEKVGELILGAGTTDELKSYSFVDSEYPAADALYYYLKQVDLDGATARSSVIEVALAAPVRALPTADRLLQNFPNPFNPETTISFDLSKEAVVELGIYNMTGQQIRTLVSGAVMSAGNYRYIWDGLDDSGAKMVSGVYFYHLKADEFTSVKKMALLK